MAKKNRHRGRFQYNGPPMKKTIALLNTPDFLETDSEKKAWERLVGKKNVKGVK
jgi:hypothetical protein